MSENVRENKMGTMPIPKLLFTMSLPLILSMLVQALYNIVDSVFVAQINENALTAVSLAFPIQNLMISVASGTGVGVNALLSKSLGEKEMDKVHKAANNGVLLAICSYLVFAVIGLVGSRAFFATQTTDPEILEYGVQYMTVVCVCSFGLFMQICMERLLQSTGMTLYNMISQGTGAIVNIILDPVFIFGIGFVPKMGVAGAAIATVTAQFLVFAVLVFRIFTSGLETNVLRELHLFSRFPGKFYKNIFRIGFPTAIQSMLYCMISMVLTRMVSAFGAAAIAVQRVGGQIESVSWNTADGFASALNAFTAQNFGAKKYDRIRQGYRISFGILTIWGLIITVAFVLLPRPISGLFFHDPESLGISVNYLTIIGFSEAFMAIELMTIGALSGLGMTKLCSIISIILTGSRIPLAMLLTHAGMGLDGIWWALSLTSIVKGIVFTLTFRHTSHTKLK